MYPFNKGKVFNVPTFAYCNNSYRDEKGSRSFSLLSARHVWVGPSWAPLPAAEKWQEFHCSAAITVMPARKPHRRDIDAGILHTYRRIFMIRGKTEFRY